MKLDGGDDEGENGDDFDEDEDVVGARRLADAADQDDRENHHDEECGDVEAEVPAGIVEVVAGHVLQAGGQIGGRDPLERGMDAEPIHHVEDVGGKADADAHVGEGVLEDQVPADDPGHQLAHGDVGVGIGRSRDGDHGGHFGVAEAGEGADDGDQHQRERQARAGAGTAVQRGVEDDPVDEGGVGDLRRVEMLAGHGGADDRENAGADDRADAESGERPRAQGLFKAAGFFRLADELVNGFAGNELGGQSSSPHRGSGNDSDSIQRPGEEWQPLKTAAFSLQLSVVAFLGHVGSAIRTSAFSSAAGCE